MANNIKYITIDYHGIHYKVGKHVIVFYAANFRYGDTHFFIKIQHKEKFIGISPFSCLTLPGNYVLLYKKSKQTEIIDATLNIVLTSILKRIKKILKESSYYYRVEI
mgnify:FL=1